MIDRLDLWLVMGLLGLGTYFIRFSFLGGLGNRLLPGWLRRALRYTSVAVLPALVAPAVIWPAATGFPFCAAAIPRASSMHSSRARACSTVRTNSGKN